MHPGGKCGNPSTQTCSKVPKSGRPSLADLFAAYAMDYTDTSGQSYALCKGSEKCCGGGVWGDVIPTGAWLLLAHKPR